MRHHGVMDRRRLLALLTEHKPVLAQRFGVVRLALFGSFAREAARDAATWMCWSPSTARQRQMPISGCSSTWKTCSVGRSAGRPVDLVTERALRHEFRPYVERDAIAIA